MIVVSLRIRRTAQPQHTAAAWFIPGSTPADWWDELARWQLSAGVVKMLVIPKGSSRLNPRGVLVLPQRTLEALPSRRCQPYGQINNRLFLPLDAELVPRLTASELDAVLPSLDRVYVFHPAVGVLGFGPEDLLELHDLLMAPRRRESAWNLARAGTFFNSHLHAVQSLDERSAEAILLEGGDDIGSESFEDLPAQDVDLSSTTETFSFLDRVLSIFRPGRNSNDRDSSGKSPASSSKPDEVARRQQQRLRQLLEMLKSNPDLGLRYALSVARQTGFRGLKDAGDALTPREPELDLTGKAATGSAAEPWFVPHDVWQQLVQRYHEMARRELALGRYRRAAYIYAHLLGDWSAAAYTLRGGGQWHDAAKVFEEKLSDARAAAECLQQGGFLAEAIEAWERVRDYERAGDLYLQLGDRDLAEQSFRKVLTQHLERHDFLAAADLLDKKLGAPDEALELLQKGWRSTGHQAARCLQKLFQTLTRLADNDRTRHSMEAIRSERLPVHLSVVAAEVFADLAQHYPSEIIRDLAGDATRTIAASRLSTRDPFLQRRLVAAVRQSRPHDRLLSRDCERFLSSLTAEPRRRRTRPPVNTVSRLRELQLSTDVLWLEAVADGPAFLAVGMRRDAKKSEERLTVLRGTWEGCIQLCYPQPSPPNVHRGIVLSPYWAWEEEWLGLHAVGHRGISLETLPAMGKLPKLVVQSTTSRPDDCVAMAWLKDRCQLVRVQDKNNQLTVTVFVEAILTKSVPVLVLNANEPVKICVANRDVYLAAGRTIAIVTSVNSVMSLDLEHTIRKIATVTPYCQDGQSHPESTVVASLIHGGVLIRNYPGTEDYEVKPFAIDLHEPIIAGLSAGWIVAASQYKSELYRLVNHELKYVSDIPARSIDPVAVLAMNDVNEFAILSRQGEMSMWRIQHNGVTS